MEPSSEQENIEEQTYRQVIQHAPDGICLFDPKTLAITHSNTAMEKMLGFETGEIEGQSITLFLKIPPAVILKRIRSIQSNGPSSSIPRYYRKKDGSFIPVSISESLVTLQGQQQVLVIIRDMTEEAFTQNLSQLEHRIDHQLLNQTPISKILSGVADHLLELFHLSLCCFFRQDQRDSLPDILAISGRPVALSDHLRTMFRTDEAFLKATIDAVRTMKHPSEKLPYFLIAPFQSIFPEPQPLKGHLFGLNSYSHTQQDFLLLLGTDKSFSRHMRPLHHLSERIGIAILRYEDMERSRLQQAAMEASLTPMFIADRHGRVEWSNAAFEQLTGYSLADVIEQTTTEHAAFPLPEYHYRLKECLKAGVEFSGEVTDQKKDGTPYTTEMRITPIRQGEGTITHYIAVLTDISDRKAREKRLQQWAFYDNLTGLPNRFLLNLLLEKEIARTDRSDRGIAVCFIDLDRFKPINDQFGHEVGDRILESVSDRLESVIRRGDIVGRLGGDEFVCLLPGITNRNALEKILDRILIAIETPLTEGEHKIMLGASIGVSLYPEDPANDPKELIHHADLAMYEAKKEGGSRYTFYMDLSSSSSAIPTPQPI
ncbi:MAG: diguanylate cyclase domain-containing protein [Leptospirales bacterium]